MVTSMNEKSARKPRNILINPDALHKARVEALRERKTIGQWLEELIEEKLAREEREKNSQNRKKTCGGRFFRGIKQSGFVEVNPLMMPVAHINYPSSSAAVS